MDYYKDAEERLKNFSTLDARLELLNKRLNKVKMRGCPKEITAIDLTESKNSCIAKDAILDLIEAQHIIKQIRKLIDEKETMKDILDVIKIDNEIEYKFIIEKYINNKTMDEIAEELGYSINSKQTLYSIKDKAIHKFLSYYWGE